MRKLIFILILTMLLCGSVEGATKIGLDRLNWSQGLPSGIEISWRNIADAPFNVNDYGAAGDGTTDDCEAIQDALDAAYAAYVASGEIQDVYVPAGTYQIDSSQVTSEILLQPRPGVHLHGAGMNQTVIRAPDAWRNSTQGVSLFFNTAEYLDGMQITDLTFDYGSELFVQGDAFATRIGASHCKNVLIENVEVRNASGSWAFVLGNGTWDDFSDGCEIRNCEFINSGDSKSGDATADFTCIYMNMRNASIHDNRFVNDAMMKNGTAIEFHNSEIRAYQNTIVNFAYGAHLGSQMDVPTTSTGQVFADNVIRAMVGMDYWTTTATDIWRDAVISGNTIFLTHRNSGDLLAGISTGTHLGGAYNISITDNKIINHDAPGGTYASAGMVLNDINSGIVAGNEIVNVTRGIQFQYVDNLTDVAISGNIVRDWGYGFTNGIYTPAFQLDFSRTTDGGRVSVSGNVAIAAGYPQYGIVVWGQNLTYIDIIDNDIQGVATSDISMQGSYSDEHVYIDHASWKGGPGSNYASDGSIWKNLANATDYRRASAAWSAIAYTYS